MKKNYYYYYYRTQLLEWKKKKVWYHAETKMYKKDIQKTAKKDRQAIKTQDKKKYINPCIWKVK